MIILLSPAKSLDFDTVVNVDRGSVPMFINEVKSLIMDLKKLSVEEIEKLMKISNKLAMITYKRFQKFDNDITTGTKQAIYAYNGDVYKGLNTDKLTKEDINYAQEHIRIISGLYGVLRPLDLIKEYRLEMNIKLKNEKGNNLYEFWKYKLTDELISELEKQDEKVIIKLSSEEYSKAISFKLIGEKYRVVDIVFKDKSKSGEYKIIGLYSKKARGMMAGFIIRNRSENVEGLKEFCQGGYIFNKELSTKKEFVFTRG